MLPLLIDSLLPLLLLPQAHTPSQANRLPTYEQCKVTSVYKGKPAMPTLRTVADRRYRTRIRNGSANGPNLAGHYTVIVLGCGTECASFVIVDAHSGRVFSNAQKNYTCAPYFTVDSSLLVTDVCSGAADRDCSRDFWQWTGTKLKLLKTTSISCRADPPEGFHGRATMTKGHGREQR
jgi:hypothetical protein